MIYITFIFLDLVQMLLQLVDELLEVRTGREKTIGRYVGMVKRGPVGIPVGIGTGFRIANGCVKLATQSFFFRSDTK